MLHTNDYFYFNGPAARAAYGGPVPLRFWYGTHLGNDDPHPGQDLTSDVMHRYLPYGSRVFVSPFDIAILSDCMVPVPSLVPAQLQANPQGAFSFTAEVGRTYDIQVSSNLTTWATLQSMMSTNAVMSIVDDGNSGASNRFY